jgi:hypothetical protein
MKLNRQHARAIVLNDTRDLVSAGIRRPSQIELICVRICSTLPGCQCDIPNKGIESVEFKSTARVSKQGKVSTKLGLRRVPQSRDILSALLENVAPRASAL